MIRIKIPELLSPAGSFPALKAAVENGCDAVYLGGKQFGARNYAENFEDQELCSAIDYCHLRGVKTFITVNTLYKNSEFKDLFSFINKMYRFGADAFIFQDIGAASLISSNFPGIPLHASTQAGVADRPGAEFLAAKGFSRVILARELSLQEIKSVSQAIIETEVFIHGALCVSYSGQCRLSGINGGRSGNRGRCAQPCRLPYKLIKDSVSVGDGYLLSPRDIMTLDILPEIAAAGVSSLKIEGRMKSPEYVALTTRMYREALDALKDGAYSESGFTVSDLTQIFNRGGRFSAGYFKSFAGLDMMSPHTPKSTGLKVGTVEGRDKSCGKWILSLEKNLCPGDGIEIWTRSEPHAGTNINKDYPAGSKAVVKIDGDINPGDPVYRSFDKELDRRLKKLCQTDTRKIQVGFSLEAKTGEPVRLTLRRGDISVTVSGEPVTAAQNSPVTREQLLERIMKTGGTTIKLVPEEIETDGNIFLTVSGINGLRREALARFAEEYLKSTRREHQEIDYTTVCYTAEQLLAEPSETCQPPIVGVDEPQKLYVLVRGEEQFEGALSGYVDRIYFEMTEDFISCPSKYREQAERNNIQLFACLPYISREGSVEHIKDRIGFLMKNGVEGFLARTYGQIQMLLEAEAVFVADHTINAFNSYSIGTMSRLPGAVGVTLSTELSLEEIKGNGSWQQGFYTEMIIHGRQVLMSTHQCPVGLYAGGQNGTNKNGKYCGLRNRGSGYVLEDRKGIGFPIRTDCESCVAYILSGAPIFALDKISMIKEIPVQGFRLMFDGESREETAQAVYAYGSMIKSGNSPDKPVEELIEKYAEIPSRRFYRGVQ